MLEKWSRIWGIWGLSTNGLSYSFLRRFWNCWYLCFCSELCYRVVWSVQAMCASDHFFQGRWCTPVRESREVTGWYPQQLSFLLPGVPGPPFLLWTLASLHTPLSSVCLPMQASPLLLEAKWKEFTCTFNHDHLGVPLRGPPTPLVNILQFPSLQQSCPHVCVTVPFTVQGTAQALRFHKAFLHFLRQR